MFYLKKLINDFLCNIFVKKAIKFSLYIMILYCWENETWLHSIKYAHTIIIWNVKQYYEFFFSSDEIVQITLNLNIKGI